MSYRNEQDAYELWEWEQQRERDYVPMSLGEQVDEAMHYEGQLHPDKAWLLSPYDTWHKNPFYSGPEVPHPEDR